MNKIFEFSEYETKYKSVLFYKIIEENNKKYLIFEYQTSPTYNAAPDYRCYFEGFCAGNIPLIYGDKPKYSNDKLIEFRIEIQDYLRLDPQYNIKQFFYNIPSSHIEKYYLSCKETFEINNEYINNKGKGRYEKLLCFVTLDSEPGDYYSLSTLKYK